MDWFDLLAVQGTLKSPVESDPSPSLTSHFPFCFWRRDIHLCLYFGLLTSQSCSEVYNICHTVSSMPGNSEDLVGVSFSFPHLHFTSGIRVTGLSPGPPPTLGLLTNPFWVFDNFSDAVSPYSEVVSDSLFLGQNQANPPCPGPTAVGLQVRLFHGLLQGIFQA